MKFIINALANNTNPEIDMEVGVQDDSTLGDRGESTVTLFFRSVNETKEDPINHSTYLTVKASELVAMVLWVKTWTLDL